MVFDGLDQRTTRFHAVLHNRRQVDSLLAQRDLAAGDPRHFEQVVHQAHHVADLAVHHVADTFADWVVLAGQSQNMEGIANRCERVSQLVGEDGKELVLAAIDITQCKLSLFALRDVARDLRGADDRPRGVPNRRDRQGNIDEPAIFRDPHRLEVVDMLTAAQAFQEAALLGVPLRWNQQRDRLANGFLSRVPEKALGTAIPGEDVAVERLADDRVI